MVHVGISYLYLCSHHFIMNTFKLVYKNEQTSYIFSDNLLFCVYIYHTLNFSLWVLFDIFVSFTKLPAKNKIIYTIPYIVVYRNMYDLFYHYHDMTYEYYKLSVGMLWIVSSPFILYIYSKTFDIDNKKQIASDFMMHVFNCLYNIHNIERNKNDFYNNVFLTLMYMFYFYTLYCFCLQKTLYKYFLIYAWLIIGINETLVLCNVICKNTFAIFLMISDVQVKCFIFGINAVKYYSMLAISNDMSMNDAKLIYEAQESLNKVEDETMCVYMKQDINNLLKNMDFSEMKKVLTDRVICKKFSNDFVTSLIKEKYRNVDDIIIMFSDVVNYTTYAQNESSHDVLQQLQVLYEEYDEALVKYTSLQKIENIGDCYMVTSLLDDSFSYNILFKCQEMFNFSLDIIQIANSYNMNTRAGIHLGSVSVGIIGKDTPRFGVVGHDVNLTARLESTCDTNCIQMSDAFYEHLVQLNNFSDKTKFFQRLVDLKNIGQHTTFTFNPSTHYIHRSLDSDLIRIK